MSKPTSAVKRRYNQGAYKRYEFSVGVDTKLNYLLEQDKQQGKNISGLIKDLLCSYYGILQTELHVDHIER